MTEKPEGGVATQVRHGGSYTVDPETGAEVLTEAATSPAPLSAATKAETAPEAAAEPETQTKKKVK